MSASADIIYLDAAPDALHALLACLRISSVPLAPAVVLVDAPADRQFLVAALLAGACATVGADRAAALRVSGERLISLSAQTRREIAEKIDPADYPILAMRLDGEPVEEIARTLRLGSDEVLSRLTAIVARWTPPPGSGPDRATSHFEVRRPLPAGLQRDEITTN